MSTTHEIEILPGRTVYLVQLEVDEAYVKVTLSDPSEYQFLTQSFPGADRKAPEGDNALELYADVIARTITERWEHLTYNDEARHCLRLLRVAAVMFQEAIERPLDVE